MVDYNLHPNLERDLNHVVSALGQGFDCVLLVDGRERVGKSNSAKAIAGFLAEKLKRKMSADNIVFDVEEMSRLAANTKKNIFIWDEAALGGLSTSWHDKAQQKFIQILMTCGKYNHVYIVVVPSFSRLNSYLALDRSNALIRCYAKTHKTGRIERGMFAVYNKTSKSIMYAIEKNKQRITMPKAAYRGIMPKVDGKVVSEEEYDKKKDEAIKRLSQNEKADKSQDIWIKRFYRVTNHFVKEKLATPTAIQKLARMNSQAYSENLALATKTDN